MTKSELTALTIRVTKVIESCNTWEQCEVAEKYMRLALDQIQKYYRGNFQITKVFKNLSEELGIVADLYGRMKRKYTETHRKRMVRLF